MKRHFIIPMNFMETGYLFYGAVSVRNAIEAGVLGLLAFLFCKILPLPEGIDGISYYILIVAPFVMVGLSGIQGDPLSVYIMDMIKWSRRRRPYFYNTHSEAYTQEAAELLMDAPQLRDYIADAVEKMRNNLAAEEMDYIEGETFVFATDPEQEALRMAQEELQKKREEEMAKRLLDNESQAQPVSESVKSAETDSAEGGSAISVDTRQIANSLVLDDLEWEEEADGEA